MMTDFELWLSRNDEKFKTYTDDEIADLAIACAFSRQEIAQWQTRRHFESATELKGEIYGPR